MPARVRDQCRDGFFAARVKEGRKAGRFHTEATGNQGGLPDMSDDDPFEVEQLERAAEWRLRKVDEDPADERSATAARELQRLAEEVRHLRSAPLFQEYVAICNWLGESDGISDFMELANDYRARIGYDRSPENGAAYLRALIDLAKQVVGTG